ncbi:MAG: rhodanese-like domain-containing protein [Saprospirales bacterium]|nr:MAG: rhodanese-like domain-containing protein [Saprospirales bacterium]
MKLNTIIFAVIILSFLGWRAYSAGYISDGNPGTHHINVQQAKDLIENGKEVQILDVRTEGEWRSGIVQNSILINLYDQQFHQKVQELNKEKPVVIICRSGNRSNQAMRAMSQMGFKELYNVRGGVNSWGRAGYELK